MGGKTKQSQRTKNNARPSSSGRSALLLSNVTLDTGSKNIIGGELPALFPTLVTPNIDPNVSPELQLCLKKLNKKDPITKVKALQELTDLVAKSEVDDVVAALPSWVHFYKILTTDPDRKVRECTQACLGAAAAAAGRRLAPQLRALLPAWLRALHDEHAPVAALAQHALHKTFPDNKLPEVIAFCKDEVMSNIVDVLIGSGESICLRKTDSAEQRQAAGVGARAAALGALRLVAARLPAAHAAWLWEALLPLLRAPRFWALRAHHDARLRAAWCACVGRAAQTFGAALGGECGARALAALCAAAADTPSALDALLLFAHHVPDWHTYLDDKELLVQIIFNVLEKGGWGDARHLSNILLPLLSRLPPAMLTKEFYTSYFNAIFNGLDKKAVLSSKSERQSWITSLDECLRYLSIQQEDYVVEVVTYVHRTWLEKILSDAYDGQIRTGLIKFSADCMSALNKYWFKQAKDGTIEKYDQLIRNFWQNVGSTMIRQIDKLSTNHDEIGRLIDAHILLVQSLKSSIKRTGKKKQSIKFEDDAPDVVPVEEVPAEIPQCDSSVLERYNHNLTEIVHKVCAQYFDFAKNKEICSPVLTPLMTLLKEFDSTSLFVAISRQFDCDGPFKLYDGVLRKWLANDTMRSKEVVDIVFLLMAHLSEPDQEAVFDSFNQFPPSVVVWCAEGAVCVPGGAAWAGARRWARGGALRRALRPLWGRLLAAPRHARAAADTRLLLALCTPCARGEIMISSEAVSDAVQMLSAALRSAADAGSAAWAAGAESAGGAQLAAAAALAARLVRTLPLPPRDLVLPLFRLTLLLPGALSAAARDEALAAWRGALHAQPPPLQAPLRRAALALLHRHLALPSEIETDLLPPCDTSAEEEEQDSDEEENCLEEDEDETVQCAAVREAERAAALAATLCGGEAGGAAGDAVDDALRVAPPPPHVRRAVLRHDVVAARLHCPLHEVEAAPREVSRRQLERFATHAVFRAAVLRHVGAPSPSPAPAPAPAPTPTHVCAALHDHTLLRHMHDAFAFWPHYKLLQKFKTKMDQLIQDIIAQLSTKSKSIIFNELSELAATEGYYWAFARQNFETLAKIDSRTYLRKTEHTEQDRSDQNDTNTSQELTSDIKTEREQTSEGTENESDEVESLDLEKINEIITGDGYFHMLEAAEGGSLRALGAVAARCVLAAGARGGAGAGERAAARAGERAAARAAALAARGRLDACLDALVDAAHADRTLLLHHTSLGAATWRAAACAAALLRAAERAVSERGGALVPRHYDFAALALCHVMDLLCDSRDCWAEPKVGMVAVSALRLHATLARGAAGAGAGVGAARRREWRDVLEPPLTQRLLAFMLHVLEAGAAGGAVTSAQVAVVAAGAESLRLVRWAELAPAARRLVPLRAAVTACVAALRSAHCVYKLAAYTLLLELLEPIVLADAETLEAWSSAAQARAEVEGDEEGEEEEGLARPPLSLQWYDAAFWALHAALLPAVQHVRVCEETCVVAGGAAGVAGGAALGLVLLADAAAAQSSLARHDTPHHYVQYYRERKYAVALLEVCLRLLPAEVVAGARAAVAGARAGVGAGAGAESASQLERLERAFCRMPVLSAYRAVDARVVAAAAARGVARAVCGPGAADVRGWRGAAHHAQAAVLDHIVARYITPAVVREELAEVQRKAPTFKDIEVTILWPKYEVWCVLTVEERPIELRITLSRSHPLGLPDVMVPPNAPVNHANWLVMYIGHQRGGVARGVAAWGGAVGARVERSAQCCVCYCRLHCVTGRLPAAHCRTCRNKFHAACLRKWFRTSNKSKCPICRSSF